ncbi:MAG: beta-ketoacyl-ACP reductase [Proteobacteria bacterium]|nr:beta-ketoacyl-ACP reductase [Pseudomonadota bacterium]
MKKAALITGASRGIGRAIAGVLAESLPVVINYRNDESAALAVQAEIREKGGEALVIRADVADYEQVRRMFDEIRAADYWVHTLVNNAGIIRDQFAIMMGLDAWHAVINCNLNGAFYCVRESVQTMMARRAGNIINISSISGLHGQVGQSNYAASKAALTGLTKSLAKELGRFNVRVNCVAPGFIETDMGAELLSNEKMAKLLELARQELLPLRRWGKPADIAGVVQFLVSSQAAYMTGQVLEVDGGLSL